MLIILFLVSHSNFLFVPCGGLSWLPVSFLLHTKYTLSYRIVLCRFEFTVVSCSLVPSPISFKMYSVHMLLVVLITFHIPLSIPAKRSKNAHGTSGSAW